MMMGNNPALKRLERIGGEENENIVKAATYKGIVFKSLYFVLLTIATALAIFFSLMFVDISAHMYTIMGLLIGSAVLSIVLALVSIFVVRATPFTGSLYAILQGAVMGFTALMLTMVGFGGEVFAALFATAVVFLIMLVLYITGLIRVGGTFRRFMMSALIGLVLVNGILFIAGAISPTVWNMFFGNHFLGVVFASVMVVFASLMLLMDFNRMTMIVQAKLPKAYEWQAAFGLLITLIWLYTQILRLFTLLRRRN